MDNATKTIPHVQQEYPNKM